MKVEIIRMPKMTIEEFAEQNSLDLIVFERANGTFEAYFKGWSSKPGNGATIQNAISDFAQKISGGQFRGGGKPGLLVPCLTVAGFYE